MIIIKNRLLPVGKGFYAINLFGVVFSKGPLNAHSRNHEFIHTLQQREMLFLFFYLWYLLEWLVGLIRYRNSHKAYRNIRFEREAYTHQFDLNYSKKRQHFAWLKLK